MRATSTVIFFIFLCVPFAGTFGWLQMTRHNIREDVVRRIRAGEDRNAYVVLRFTLAESRTLPDWHHPGEFEYQGMMYDIVESEICGDEIYYTCLPDTKESLVNACLRSFLRQVSNPGCDPDQVPYRFAEFLKVLCHITAPAWSTLSIYHLIKPHVAGSRMPVDHKMSPPVPPPWRP